MIPSPQFQAVDAAKANMSKMNSKQEIPLEVVDNRPPLPTPMPVEPRPMSGRPQPLPPPKVGPITPNIDAYERMVYSEAKKSQSAQLRASGRESRWWERTWLPPRRPRWKPFRVRSGPGSARQIESPGLSRAGNPKNSASAKKLEPLASDVKAPIKRQSSASRLMPSSSGGSARNLPSPMRSEKQIPKVPPKLPPKMPEKPLPPSANSFKKPPAKSMVNPTRQGTNEANKVVRYSTNPNNSSMNRGDGRDKVMKFDDFIKNFDESNNRLSKLRQRPAEAVGSARAPRYSSVKQKARA